MSAPRFYVDTELTSKTEVQLPQETSHYIANVLRLKVDDAVVVFNGRGGEYSAHIVNIGKRAVTVTIRDFISRECESNIRIDLIQGVSKGERMDWVVQKAVELGVSRIIPVFTQYGMVHLDEDRAAKKKAHWQAIVRSACEQSRRNRVPEVLDPSPFSKWIGTYSEENRLKLMLEPGASTHFKSLTCRDGFISILVGPEGGLSSHEVQSATSAGFLAVTMGPRVLRTETAALAAISSLQTLFGDMG